MISRTLFNYYIYIFHRVYIFIPIGHFMKLLRWNVQLKFPEVHKSVKKPEKTERNFETH